MCPTNNGVTLHITLRNELFISYTSGNFEILMGNDGVSKMVSVGDVYLQTNMGM